MRHFELDINVSVALMVPDDFTKQMREQAASEEATEFLKKTQAAHPEDDDAFTLACVENGISVFTRRSLAMFFAQAGIGYKFPEIPTDKEQTNLVKVDVPSHGDPGALEQGEPH
jgi:hypothetical protein